MFSVFRMSAVTYFIFQQVELLGQLAKYLQKLVVLLLLPKELQEQQANLELLRQKRREVWPAVCQKCKKMQVLVLHLVQGYVILLNSAMKKIIKIIIFYQWKTNYQVKLYSYISVQKCFNFRPGRRKCPSFVQKSIQKQ